MCALCVKNIFLRICKLFGIYICTAQVHCLQPTRNKFLKINALQGRPFTFYVEIVSIIFERSRAVAQSVWRKTTDEKWKNYICSVRAPKIST